MLIQVGDQVSDIRILRDYVPMDVRRLSPLIMGLDPITQVG